MLESTSSGICCAMGECTVSALATISQAARLAPGTWPEWHFIRTTSCWRDCRRQLEGLTAKEIGETENHSLMILTARYFANQLLYQRDRNPS